MSLLRDLRAFCRPPIGVPVSFAGVSTYPDDGSPVCGIFERPVGFKLLGEGIGGAESAVPTLLLPCNAFSPMPQAGDEVSITSALNGAETTWRVNQPSQEDDGAFLLYDLQATE